MLVTGASGIAQDIESHVQDGEPYVLLHRSHVWLYNAYLGMYYDHGCWLYGIVNYYMCDISYEKLINHA